MTEHDQEPTEHDLAEHDPVESARPSIGRRDEPDAIRPDPDDRPHRTLPPREEDDDTASHGTASDGAPDAPRPTESPAGRD
jgi:hypothetical protein